MFCDTVSILKNTVLIFFFFFVIQRFVAISSFCVVFKTHNHSTCSSFVIYLQPLDSNPTTSTETRSNKDISLV